MKDLYGYFRTRIDGVGRNTATAIIAGDDYVAVECRGEMTARSGVPYNNEYCLVFRLRDRKIVEMREYCDSVLTETALGKYPTSAAT